MQSRFLFLAAVFGVAGCSSDTTDLVAQVDGGPDAGVLDLGAVKAVDMGVDAGVPDSGATRCQRFCFAQANCLFPTVKAEIRRGIQRPECALEAEAVTECEQECEDIGIREDCAVCAEGCNPSCNCGDRSTYRDLRNLAESSIQCWPPPADPPEEECGPERSGSALSISYRSDEDARRFEGSHTGTVSVLSVDDRGSFELELGEDRVVVVFGRGDLVRDHVGSTLHLRAEFSPRGFGFQSAFVLRGLSGELILAGWVGRTPLPVSEVSLQYRASRCLAVRWSYTRAMDLDLRANGERIPRADFLDINGYRVHNGNGVVLYAVRRTDTSSPNYAGMIEPVP